MSVRNKRIKGRRQGVKEITWTERPIKGAPGYTALPYRRRPFGVSTSSESGEFKSVDTAAVVAMNTAPGVVALLNGISRGDDIGQRNGREVTMKSIQFQAQTSGGAADSFCRFLLVYDRQSNGTPLTAAQVLNVVDIVSPRNLENRKRFKILHDVSYPIETTANALSLKVHKFYRRLAHPITFNTGNAGTVADIATGSLYLIALGSNAAGGNAAQFTYSCRIRYLDK